MPHVIHPPRPASSAGPSLSYWLGAKLTNAALAMDADAAARLHEAISSRAFDHQVALDIGGAGANKFVGTKDQRSRFRVTDDGICIVPIQGILIDRGEWLGDLGGWATSYEGLAEQCRRIEKDDAIKAVILDIDCPGGMAAGVAEAAAAIRQVSAAGKRVYAIAANMAASGGYWLGCAADEFVCTSAAAVGSIGVIQMHASIAGMMERAGVEVTIMHAGKHKADGNPYQALGHLARHQMTGEIDRLYSDFCAHVAKHRPLDNQAVRATEARVFYGRGAVDAKLADKVMSFDELLAHVRNGQTASRGKPSRGGRMSNNQTPAAGRPDYESVIAASLATIAANQQPRQADPAPAAAAAPAPAAAAAPAAAPVDAAKAERERIGAIIGSEDGKKRPGLANHLAFETEMSAEAAGKILAAAPVEHVAAAAPTQAAGLATALEQRMAQTGNSGGIVPAAASTATARKSFSQIAAETAGRK